MSQSVRAGVIETAQGTVDSEYNQPHGMKKTLQIPLDPLTECLSRRGIFPLIPSLMSILLSRASISDDVADEWEKKGISLTASGGKDERPPQVGDRLWQSHRIVAGVSVRVYHARPRGFYFDRAWEGCVHTLTLSRSLFLSLSAVISLVLTTT